MRIIDLSQPLRSGMGVYPGDPEVEIKVVQERAETGWELRALSLGSHTGTHVDAFSHAHVSGKNLDEIPLDRFIVEARCVSTDQTLPNDVGLIFSEHVSVSRLPDILEIRPPFVGGPSFDEELEMKLLGNEILTFDGLINLDRLPLGVTFTFCGFPLKIVEGDGSPIRAVVLID